jgi:hypothetical protein
LVAVGLVIAMVTVVLARSDGDDGTGAGGEVFLEAAGDAGADPFTDPADPAVPASSVVVAPTDGPLAVPPSGVAPASGVAPPPGSPPYGGSGDDQVCDRERLVEFLAAQPERAAAWGGVLGVAVDDIPSYVRALTPTVLLYDTRVTNHGFSGGRATPRQSVLQAGTAVLVDGAGDPVVRCRCGNPLRAPAPLARPAVVGTPWPGFDPVVLVAVEAGVTVTVTIEVSGDDSSTATSDPSTSDTTTTDPTTSDTVTPTSESVPGPTVSPDLTDLDRQAAEGLLAVVAECTGGAQVTLLDVEPLEGFTGGFTILLDVGGTQMLFVYEPATGTITEGDQPSAELLTACGVL